MKLTDVNLKKEKELSNLLEDVRAGLERSVEKRTKEVKDLLDNMNSAVFAIGKDYKILNPVSKYSEKIFKKKIVGKRVSETIFYNVKKGTKEYSDWVKNKDGYLAKALKKAGVPDNSNACGPGTNMDVCPSDTTPGFDSFYIGTFL